jgi:putative FmdB family regulatory protein
MPLREFRCGTCHFVVERLEFTPDPNYPTCPRCAEEVNEVREMEKMMSRSSFALKGSGWCRPATYQAPRRGSDL